MVVKNQCVRCGRFPVLDPGGLAKSLTQHIVGSDERRLRIAAGETVLDLHCLAEQCQRAPRREKPAEVLP